MYTGTTTVRHLSKLLLLLLTPGAVTQSSALLRSGFSRSVLNTLTLPGIPRLS